MTTNTEKPLKVLVTGGGGFLGSAIARKLISRGDEVYSFSRSEYKSLRSMGVKQIQGDIADKESVSAAVKGMDIVYHVAAKPGVWGKYSEYYLTNVVGTRNVVSACREHNINRLIYTSSPSVVFNGKDMEGIDESFPYPDKFHTHYPKTKAIAEQFVRKAADRELKVIIIRPHLIWGPEDNHLVPRIIERAKRLVKVGKRNNLVDTVYVDNAADAHILAADKLEKCPELSGNVYFVSQDDPVPLWDMVNRILKAGGKDPIKKSAPHKLVWFVGAVLEIIYKVLRLKGEPLMTRFVADELATAHWFDISAAKNDLGYVPKISTEEGLLRLKKWLDKKQI